MSQPSICEKKLPIGTILHSTSSAYLINEYIDKGCYGTVVRATRLVDKETVAMKLIKDSQIQYIEEEVAILETIKTLNPDENNLLKFYEYFKNKGWGCLVAEMLDRNLYNLDCRLSLQDISLIAKQLLEALEALSCVGIIHTDIKPDNIMVVNIQDPILKVKLIDFGESIRLDNAYPGMDIQPFAYRAPEIILGLPFNEAIDVWGVGCILAFLYLRTHLFAFKSELHMVISIFKVLGEPEDHLLNAGLYTQKFFTKEKINLTTKWCLKETQDLLDSLPKGQLDPLEDLIYNSSYRKNDAFEDKVEFVVFLRQLLHLDRKERISAHQGQQHPFITKYTNSSSNLDIIQATMDQSPITLSTEGVNSSVACPPHQDTFIVSGTPSAANDNPLSTSTYHNRKYGEVLPISAACHPAGVPPALDDVDPDYLSDEEIPTIPAAYHSAGVPPVSDDEDLDFLSDEEIPTIPAAYHSAGVPRVSDDEDPDFLSDEEIPSIPAAYYFAGVPPASNDEDPDFLFDEEIPTISVAYHSAYVTPVSNDEDPDFLFDEEIPTLPATYHSNGAPPALDNDYPDTWSDEEIPTIPTAYHFAGVLPVSNDEDPDFLFDEEIPTMPATYHSNGAPPASDDDYPDTWFDDEEIPTMPAVYHSAEVPPASDDDYPDTWFDDEEIPTMPAVYHSAEVLPPSDDEDPDIWTDKEIPTTPAVYHSAEVPPASDDDYPDTWFDDEEIPTMPAVYHSAEVPPASDDEDPDIWTDKEIPTTPAACHSAGVPPVSDDKDPEVCSSNGEIPTPSATCNSVKYAPSVLDDNNTDIRSCDGEIPCVKDDTDRDPSPVLEESAASSSDGAVPILFTPDVSTSLFQKFKKKISSLLKRIRASLCCCLRPRVND